MTNFGQKEAVAMPERCECSHNKSRHMLAGFDGECGARLAALRAKARADAVGAELKAAKETKARRKAERRAGPGTHPCTRAGCDRTFGSGQARSLHERRTHDGFNPHAAKASA